MSETRIARAEVPLEYMNSPEAIDRLEQRVRWTVADGIAAHLLANREAAIAYRVTVRKDEGRNQPGMWRDVMAYELYLEALHISYERTPVYHWPSYLALDDPGAILPEPVYMPMWKAIPHSEPPTITRTVTKTVVKWRGRLGGFSTRALLGELRRRCRRRTIRFNHWMQRMAEPVDVPDRSNYERAILDWGR